MYRLMRYTMRTLCCDGVIRTFERIAYFRSADLLRFWLSCWSGEQYQYYETPEQLTANELAAPDPRRIHEFPWGTILRWGKQQHEYTFVGNEIKPLAL